MKWNKLGYYRLDDVAAYFFAFALIGIGVAAAVIGFYGQDIDVRGEEARILNYKLYNVLKSYDGLNLDVFEKGYDVLGSAGIDKEVFGNGDYFYRIALLKRIASLWTDTQNPVLML